MNKKKKEIIALIIFLIALISFIVCASAITTPKRYELGANWGAFTEEKKDSMDVVFFGSSMAYCNVIPAIIWENNGLSSYVMAGPEQPLSITYYYVKEMFRHQSPSAVMVEISGIIYGQYASEGATKANISYMPYNINRFGAIINGAPKSEWLGLFFPLYNYHDRWNKLTEDDYEIGLTGYDIDLLAGYHFLSDNQPQPEMRERDFEQTEEGYQYNLSWLEKIAQLCREHNCRPIFYISASYAYFNESYLERLEADLANIEGVEFINFMDNVDEMDIDASTDFYDILHFNYRGAEKFSRFLAETIDELGIKAQNPYNDPQLWQERIDHYRSLIAQSSTQES